MAPSFRTFDPASASPPSPMPPQTIIFIFESLQTALCPALGAGAPRVVMALQVSELGSYRPPWFVVGPGLLVIPGPYSRPPQTSSHFPVQTAVLSSAQDG